jgi:hypothetical protein
MDAHSFRYDHHARLEGHINGIFDVWTPWLEHVDASTKAPATPRIVPGGRLTTAGTVVGKAVLFFQNTSPGQTVAGDVRSG